MADPQEQQWNPVDEARQSYPALKDWSDARILNNLSDPKKFKSAFPQYSHLDDSVIKKNIGELQLTHLTSNDEGQGTYEMAGPDGKKVKIAYGKIKDAADSGYKMTDTDRKRYLTDAAADKNINKDKSLPEGVKVVGKNSAGQDIVAPEGTTTGSFLDNFAKSEYGAIKAGAKGLGKFLNPNASEEEKQRGQTSTFDILMRYPERMIQPNADMAAQATQEAKAGNYSSAAEHGIASVVPVVGPFAASVIDQAGGQIANRDYGGAAGTVVGNAVVAEAPGVLGKTVKGVATLPVKVGGKLVDAVTRTGPREVANLAKATLDENAAEVTRAKEVNEANADKHLNATIDAVKKAHKYIEKEESRSEKLDRANEQKRKEFNKKELERVQSEGQARLDALKKNKDKLADYEERREIIKKENEANYRAQVSEHNIQNELKSATDTLENEYGKAVEKGRTQYNSVWNTWRDMLKKANAKADMSSTVDTILGLQSSMNPMQVSLFKEILNESAPDEVGVSSSVAQASLQDLIAKKLLGGAYKQAMKGQIEEGMEVPVISGFHEIASDAASKLDAAKAAQQAAAPLNEIPAERLHAWKSQLERAVRTTSDGIVRSAIGKVLDQVRDQENKVTASVGPKAVKQLTKARAITGPYFDTFFKEEADLPPVAGKSLREQSPLAKERGAEGRLNNLARYNSELVSAAKKVSKLSENLEKLRKKREIGKRSELPAVPAGSTMTAQGPVLNKDHTSVPPRSTVAGEFQPKRFESKEVPKSAVAPDRPPDEIPDFKSMSAEDLKNWKKNNLTQLSKRIRDLSISRALYAGMTALPVSIATFAMGHLGAGALEVSTPGAVVGFSNAVADLLEKPGVVEYLSRVTNKDVAAFEKLPPEQKAVFKSDMSALTKEAKKQGVRISPVLADFIKAGTVTGATTEARKPKPTPKELLEQAHQNLQSGMYSSGYGGNQ